MSSIALLRLTIGISFLVACYQAIVFHLGSQTTEEFEKLWGLTFLGLLTFWVDTDSQRWPQIYRPSFDIGLFMYLIWILYLPYYLIRTRGRLGWLWLLGLIVLLYLGTLMQWVVYAAS
jgi:hypothetical protein